MTRAVQLTSEQWEEHQEPAVLKRNILLQEITNLALWPNVFITSQLLPMYQATAPTKHGGLKYLKS